MSNITQNVKEAGATGEKKRPPPPFRQYAVDEFNPTVVLERLATADESVKWQRPILLRGLCAWILDNGDRGFIRDSMVRYISDRLAQRQDKLRALIPYHPDHSFIRLPTDGRLTPILKFAFEPFGGVAALMKMCSAKELEKKLEERRSYAKPLIDLATVMHLYSVTGGRSGHPNKMTLQYACELVEELQGRRKRAKLIPQALGVDSLRDRWEDMARASALIYTASLLVDGQGVTLFDRIFTSAPKYSRNQILRWLKTAKRVTRIIPLSCAFQKGRHDLRLLGGYPRKLISKEPPPPRLRLCEAWWLVEQFQDVPKTWPEITVVVQRHSQQSCSIADGASRETACAACKKFSRWFDSGMQPVMHKH